MKYLQNDHHYTYPQSIVLRSPSLHNNFIYCMNVLPEILRDNPHRQPIMFRQPPVFGLKLDSSFRNAPTFSNEKQFFAKTSKTRLKINRYILQRGTSHTKTNFNNTISYDHMSDPQFYGTKGKKDRVDSMQSLVKDLQKATDIVQLKVASLNGTKEHYLTQLKEIERRATQDLTTFQNDFGKQIRKLKHFLSDLRRETGQQQTFFKQSGKQINSNLIQICEAMSSIQQRRKKCQSQLELP